MKDVGNTQLTTKEDAMTESERTGEFTYDSYYAHLKDRLNRITAEIHGFGDARLRIDQRYPVDHLSKDYQEHYQIGFYMGTMYMEKDNDQATH